MSGWSKCIFGGLGGGCGVGGVRPITFNCTDTHTWCYARDIFSCTYTHTSCYTTDIFSCTHTHTRLFTLETSSLPHTHIFPATLETSYLALTHILLFTLETSSLAHTHILMLRYRCFLLHIHILPASLYTSFLAFTRRFDDLPIDIFSCTYIHTSCYSTDVFCCTHTHTSCYARGIFSCTYTRRRKKRALKKLCPVELNGMLQVTMGVQNPRDFQGAILTWHDYSAVAPSTFDSKTWTTASAVVTLLGCLCLLGFTETIPTSFKKFVCFAFLNSNKTKTL